MEASKTLNAKTEQLAEILKHAEDSQMEREDHVCRIHYQAEAVKDLRAAVDTKADLVVVLTTRQEQYREEVETSLKRIHELSTEVSTVQKATAGKEKEIKELEEQLEALKVRSEDEIQELKFQLAEAKGSKAAQDEALKAALQ